MKGINIFLADGFEDMEALAANDVLRRAGLHTTLVSITGDTQVRSSHGISIIADCTLAGMDTSHQGTDSTDFMVFPGGMPGTRNLAACQELMSLMNGHYAAGGSVAAICAAPGLVLGQLKGAENVRFTCFEGFQEQPKANGWTFCRRPSVGCGRIITGRSAGYAVNFGLEILKAIAGDDAVHKVEAGVYSQNE